MLGLLSAAVVICLYVLLTYLLYEPIKPFTNMFPNIRTTGLLAGSLLSMAYVTAMKNSPLTLLTGIAADKLFPFHVLFAISATLMAFAHAWFLAMSEPLGLALMMLIQASIVLSGMLMFV